MSRCPCMSLNPESSDPFVTSQGTHDLKTPSVRQHGLPVGRSWTYGLSGTVSTQVARTMRTWQLSSILSLITLE